MSSVHSEGKSKSQNTGFSFYQLSSVQSGGKSKSQNTGFPFYQFIKQAKHIHGNRYTLNSNTFTTRSENSYKRSGARTPINVREFKLCQANVRQSVQANTLTTRSGNGYKRSGVHTPNNVREFKRFATAVQASSEETRRVRINVHGKYPANCINSTV